MRLSGDWKIGIAGIIRERWHACLRDGCLEVVLCSLFAPWSITSGSGTKMLIYLVLSVVSAQADIFAKNLTKIGKILRIFDELDEIKSRWVLYQS